MAAGGVTAAGLSAPAQKAAATTTRASQKGGPGNTDMTFTTKRVQGQRCATAVGLLCGMVSGLGQRCVRAGVAQAPQARGGKCRRKRSSSTRYKLVRRQHAGATCSPGSAPMQGWVVQSTEQVNPLCPCLRLPAINKAALSTTSAHNTAPCRARACPDVHPPAGQQVILPGVRGAAGTDALLYETSQRPQAHACPKPTSSGLCMSQANVQGAIRETRMQQ